MSKRLYLVDYDELAGLIREGERVTFDFPDGTSLAFVARKIVITEGESIVQRVDLVDELHDAHVRAVQVMSQERCETTELFHGASTQDTDS